MGPTTLRLYESDLHCKEMLLQFRSGLPVLALQVTWRLEHFCEQALLNGLDQSGNSIGIGFHVGFEAEFAQSGRGDGAD